MTRTLIEKLEAADGPSRELDAEIFEALASTDGKAAVMQGWETIPAYTSSLDAAVALVERVLPPLYGETLPAYGWKWGVYKTLYWTAWVREHGDEGVEVMRKTPALALCIALLKALEARDEANT